MLLRSTKDLCDKWPTQKKIAFFFLLPLVFASDLVMASLIDSIFAFVFSFLAFFVELFGLIC